MPGYAGNFLTRLFGLSPETIPLVPIDILKQLVSKNIVPSAVDDRVKYYSFEQVNDQYANWQEFHRAWPDFYNRKQVDYFNTVHAQPYSHVIYSIHPHEFNLMEKDIVKTDADFYSVELTDLYLPWVFENQKKLNFEYRPTYEGELAQCNLLKTKYNMKSIDLTNILSSKESFKAEYLKTVNDMGLTAVIDSAQNLYDGWMSVRGPR
jgi:hypothetical protein